MEQGVQGTKEDLGGFVGIDNVDRTRAWSPEEIDKLLRDLVGTRPTRGSSPRRTGRISVVDDEPLVQSFAKVLFNHLGYDVDVCGDGMEAVEYCKSHADAVDLVLLDMIMPRMGGDEAFYRIREYWPDARILVVSGYAGNARISKLLEDGAIGFLSKPFTLSDLADALPHD